MTQLINDQSQESVSVQKQILKIYFALTQYVLPLDLISREVFGQWMEILRVITESDVPDHTLQVMVIIIMLLSKSNFRFLMPEYNILLIHRIRTLDERTKQKDTF